MNPIIESFFIPDTSQKVVLPNGKCRLYYLGEDGEKRTKEALRQATLAPVPLATVFAYINEFLNYIVDFPIAAEKSGDIILEGKKEDVIGHGIWIKNEYQWKPQSNKPPYLSNDPKYEAIQKYFNFSFQKDIVWIKFTKDGYVGVVCDSSDINHSYSNTSGKLIRSINQEWDTKNLFVFPITGAMTKYKKRKQIETGIGQYLISKSVPIIDFYSHNNF